MTLSMTDSAYTLSLDIDDFRQSRVEMQPGVNKDLVAGEICVRVDKIAMTANSISYGFAGKSGLIRYLDIYPASDGYANLPCWGYGDIVQSSHPDITIGDRVYGFLPIASHVTMAPGDISHSGFTDTRECRAVVPPFYNEYTFTKAEPGYAPQFEEAIMLFRPLFGTSFLMQSYCEDHDFYGAKRIVVTSASAKTSMGFGYLMRKHFSGTIETIGLTSSKNKAFVEGLNCYDTVLTYDEVPLIPVGADTLIFDVAGNADVVGALHTRLGNTIPYSGAVGKTHWNAGAFGANRDLPGAKPVFWSAPDQIAVLRERIGSGAMMRQMGAAMIDFMVAASGWIQLSESHGPEAMTEKIRDMLDGNVGAEEGIILRP